MHSKATPKDEESSHILEQLDMDGKKAMHGGRNDEARFSTSATVFGTADSSKSSPTILPDDGILVETADLEQSVRRL